MQRRQSSTFGSSAIFRHAGSIRALVGAVALLGLALSGCAAPRSADYMGISLVAGEAPAELQSLAMKAKSGDKQAQLELGEHFEQGTLVPVDLERARKLYTEAASNSVRTMPSYVNFRGGAVMLPTEVGPKTPGLPEAQARLENLNKKRDQPQDSEASQAEALPANPNDEQDPQ